MVGTITPDEAKSWVNAHKKELVAKYCAPFTSLVVEKPYIMFMAGSPGAGKTELSRSIIKKLKEHDPPIFAIRLDTDELRESIPGYDGHNSDLFQSAASNAMSYILNEVFKRHYNALIDTTFAATDKVKENIFRALKRDYDVNITYIIQNPLRAWFYTKIRERLEGRTVPIDVFLRAYKMAPENILQIKREYGSKVSVDIVVKNEDNQVIETPHNLDIPSIEKYVNMMYNDPLLTKKLEEIAKEFDKK